MIYILLRKKMGTKLSQQLLILIFSLKFSYDWEDKNRNLSEINRGGYH